MPVLKNQATIPDLPERIVPTGPLRPTKPQNEAPLELEQVEIDSRQKGLFDE